MNFFIIQKKSILRFITNIIKSLLINNRSSHIVFYKLNTVKKNKYMPRYGTWNVWKMFKLIYYFLKTKP